MTDLNNQFAAILDRLAKLERASMRQAQDRTPGNFTSGLVLFGSSTGKITQDTAGATGTWTPTYLGGTTPGTTTYSVQSGQWVRLGPAVIATAIVLWSAATGTGEARISLPFTSGVSNGFAYGSGFTDSVTIGTFTPYVFLNPNNQYVRLYTPANNAASVLVNIEAAGDIRFTIAYRLD